MGPLTRLTFDNLIEHGRSANPRDRELFRNLVADARAFAEEPDGWLLVHGPSGAGKTHVAAAIANRCIERGQPALFVVVPDLLDHLRAAYNPNSEMGYDALLRAGAQRARAHPRRPRHAEHARPGRRRSSSRSSTTATTPSCRRSSRPTSPSTASTSACACA